MDIINQAYWTGQFKRPLHKAGEVGWTENNHENPTRQCQSIRNSEGFPEVPLSQLIYAFISI